jgi:benzylsuccinate CoA-transferase BbsF subunit
VVGTHPLSGLKIVELGGFAAGPAIGKHLGDQGAEVIRIESRARPDGFRTNYPPFAGNQAGLERAAMFAITNNDKLGVTLNLKDRRGHDLACRLIERADVVIENFTPGTMDRLGLGHAELSRSNPGLITLSTCNQGASGPHSRRAGFGTQLTALSGFTHLTGWPDRPPALLWGPFIDYIAVAYGAVAVLAALEERRRSGRGCHIDLSQLETGIQFMAPALTVFFATGEVPQRAGNADPAAFPHAVFPCAGDERWVAISVHDDGEWERLREVIGLEGVDRARSEEAIGGWTSQRPRETVIEALRAAGVHVAPVNDMRDVFSDPQLAHRRVWRRLTHGVIGEHHVPGPPYQLSDTSDRIQEPAPVLGQHNRSVLSGVLGLSEEEVSRLEAEGVLE